MKHELPKLPYALDALAPHDVTELDSRELSLEEVFFSEF